MPSPASVLINDRVVLLVEPAGGLTVVAAFLAISEVIE
jgi:hypothetical protein